MAACGSEEEGDNKDLSENRAGAMENYAVGTTFKATEPLSFSMLYNNHPNYQLNEGWLFWEELKKRTNVTIESQAVPLSDYEQKRALVVSAGDAPMIIPKTYPGQEDQFVASGAILPVSDYIDLMPNFKDKVAKWQLGDSIAGDLMQADGKYYLLPGLHEKSVQDYTLAMRTDILAELGLQAPDTWDGVYNVLKAMKAKYPNSYPLSDRFSQPTPGGNLLNIMGRAYGTRGGWDVQNGNIHTWDYSANKYAFTGAMPQYKQMLEFANKLVAEGLLDPESFSQTDDQARQKLATGKSFVISTNAQNLVNDYRPDLAKTLPNATIAKIPYPKGPAGDIVPDNRLENGVMISAKARESKNFVAMMQFIDWLFYSDEGQEFSKWGVEGTTFTKDAAGNYKLAADVDMLGLNPGAPKHLQKDFGFYNGIFTYGGSAALVQSSFPEEERQYQQQLASRKLLEIPPPAPFNEEEREQTTLWAQSLKDHVQSNTLKFILGQRPLTEWDAYVGELKSKNMDQYMEVVQTAYERFQKDHGGK